MTTRITSRRGGTVAVRRWLLLTAVVLVAINLRGPIAAVSPVLPELRATLGLGSGSASLLTSIPVLCFSIAAPAASMLAARTGLERAISIGLAGIALGTVVRSLDGPAAMLAGTVIIGVAITVGNVLVPVVIKRDFADRVGIVTGLYTAALAGGAALTAALTAPIAAAGGWRLALAVWAGIAVLAWCAWARPGSRRLHAGRRLGHKQAPPRLVPEPRSCPGFDLVLQPHFVIFGCRLSILWWWMRILRRGGRVWRSCWGGSPAGSFEWSRGVVPGRMCGVCWRRWRIRTVGRWPSPAVMGVRMGCSGCSTPRVGTSRGCVMMCGRMSPSISGMPTEC
ncbi:MAG: MFS transporter [Actinophytocola sp.]|nr:MFS transporter [Actinophytocola sp.]